MFALFTQLYNLLFPPRPFPLLSLPPELRTKIYSNTLPYQKIYLKTSSPSKPITEPPLLRTSKAIRTEARQSFYSSIELKIPYLEPLYPPQVSQIPHHQLVLLRRFVINYVTRLTITIQLTGDPASKLKQEVRMRSDKIGVSMRRKKFYVRVLSSRKDISREFCEEFAELVAEFADDVFDETGRTRESGLWLEAQELQELMKVINLKAPMMLQEMCGVRVNLY